MAPLGQTVLYTFCGSVLCISGGGKWRLEGLETPIPHVLYCVMSRVYHMIKYHCGVQLYISYSGRIHCMYVVPERF